MHLTLIHPKQNLCIKDAKEKDEEAAEGAQRPSNQKDHHSQGGNHPELTKPSRYLKGSKVVFIPALRTCHVLIWPSGPPRIETLDMHIHHSPSAPTRLEKLAFFFPGIANSTLANRVAITHLNHCKEISPVGPYHIIAKTGGITLTSDGDSDADIILFNKF